MLLYESLEDGYATRDELTAYMQDALKNNTYNYCETAIMRLYKYQTEFEQNNQVTYDRNGIGFNSFDAKILSSFAKQLLEGKHLTSKQLVIAKRRMIKYASQLINTYIQSKIIKQVDEDLYKWTPIAKRNKLKKIVQDYQNKELPDERVEQTDLFDQY